MTEVEQKILEGLQAQWQAILGQFEQASGLKKGQMVVMGCSTSEVLGKKIGKAGNKDVAEALLVPFLRWTRKEGIYPAFQCCEHLNRALVVEQEAVEKFGLEPVAVIPTLKAGGAMAAAAWEMLPNPVVVEQVKAHAGIDIGDTLIGMHLRSVVVPLRLDNAKLGNAHLVFAKTRPKYIGGPRAVYPCPASQEK